MADEIASVLSVDRLQPRPGSATPPHGSTPGARRRNYSRESMTGVPRILFQGRPRKPASTSTIARATPEVVLSLSSLLGTLARHKEDHWLMWSTANSRTPVRCATNRTVNRGWGEDSDAEECAESDVLHLTVESPSVARWSPQGDQCGRVGATDGEGRNPGDHVRRRGKRRCGPDRGVPGQRLEHR